MGCGQGGGCACLKSAPHPYLPSPPLSPVVRGGGVKVGVGWGGLPQYLLLTCNYYFCLVPISEGRSLLCPAGTLPGRQLAVR